MGCQVGWQPTGGKVTGVAGGGGGGILRYFISCTFYLSVTQHFPPGGQRPAGVGSHGSDKGRQVL